MKYRRWNKPYIDTGDGYEDIKKLKEIIGKGKYRLDCGHKVTLGHNFGNDFATILLNPQWQGTHDHLCPLPLLNRKGEIKDDTSH